MALTSVLGTIAATFGSLMSLSPLLQARSIRRSRSSRDVSIGAMWLFALNNLGWTAYGVAAGSVFILVPNLVGLAALGVAIPVARSHRPRASGLGQVAVADAADIAETVVAA
jgi:uncharacterized protein with PQ loop repeat